MDDRFNMLGRLAAGVAHDLSNYLWVADLSLLKLERRAAEAGLAHCARSAREATQRALELSECLLAYARGGAPTPVAVDLGELVHRVLLLFRAAIPDHVDLAVRTQPDTPAVDGVVPELEQLVLNLVLNACEAMPDGGTLEIAVRQAGASVLLEVSDSGRRLPPTRSVLDRPAASSSERRRAGDLGLAIVRGVAERHAATLQVAPRQNGGDRFIVYFPRRSQP